jgi:predicted nucleic acid-binding protein
LTLIDTNVLLDILSQPSAWTDWAVQALDQAALRGPLWINDVVYAECSIRFDTVADVDSALSSVGIDVLPIPKLALFAAGKSAVQYRRAGGTRTGVLPDFFIGAHAAVAGIPLLTRDAKRYRSYFPTVELITPPEH